MDTTEDQILPAKKVRVELEEYYAAGQHNVAQQNNNRKSPWLAFLITGTTQLMRAKTQNKLLNYSLKKPHHLRGRKLNYRELLNQDC